MTTRGHQWVIAAATVLSLAGNGVAAPALAAIRSSGFVAAPQAPHTVDVQAGIYAVHAPGNYGRLSYFSFGTFALVTNPNFNWIRLDTEPMYLNPNTVLKSAVMDEDYGHPLKEGAWSPDSKRLAYFGHTTNNDQASLRMIVVETYYRLQAEAAQIRKMQSPLGDVIGTDPSWHPNGRSLIYADADGDIASIDVSSDISETQVSTPVKLYDSTTRVRFPRWSADGTRIVFAEELPGEPDVHNLAVIDSDGTNRVALTSFTNGDDSQPAWSPDGQSIVFSRWDRRCSVAVILPERRYDLFSIASSGGDPVRLTYVAAQDQTNECNHTAEEAHWSPDGRELFFATTNPDNTSWFPPGATGPITRSLKYSIYRMDPVQRAAIREVQLVSGSSNRTTTLHFPQVRPLVLAGKGITYTLVARNRDTTSSATGLTLTGELPEGVQYVSHTAPAGWNCTAGLSVPTTVTCTGASLGAGQIVTVPIQTKVLPDPELGHVITGRATVSASSGDGDPNNNVAEVVRQVVSPLPVITTTLGTTAASCQPVTTYITVTARTPVTYCYQINANRTAPLINRGGVNLRYDSAGALLDTRFWGPENPSQIFMPLTPLTYIQVASEEPPEERRHKSSWSGEIFDTAGTVTSTTYMTEVVMFNADLSMSISPTTRLVDPRAPVTFTMVISNTGPDTPVVNVRNTLTGFFNPQAQASRGTCTVFTESVACKLGTMAVGATAYMTITALSPGRNGQHVSIGSVTGSGLIDTDMSDNTANALVTVKGLDLQTFLPITRRQ